MIACKCFHSFVVSFMNTFSHMIFPAKEDVKMKKCFTLLIFFVLFITACTNKDEEDNTDEVEKSIPTYQIGESETIINHRDEFKFKVTVNDYDLMKQTDKYDINEKHNDFEPDFFEDAYVFFINVTIESTSDKGFRTGDSRIYLKVDEEYYTPSIQKPMYLRYKNDEATEETEFFYPRGYDYIPSGKVIETDLVYFVTIDQKAAEANDYQLIFESGQQGETRWDIPDILE